jgi:small subunit ribosomal protein S11
MEENNPSIDGKQKADTNTDKGKSALDVVFNEVSQKKEEDKIVKKTAEKKTVRKAVKRKKKKAIKHIAIGNVYIQATYNNTIITFADQNGNVIGWSSAGKCGFKGPKKSTPYAAGVIVKDAVENVKESGFKDAYVFVKGVGLGREAAIRALNAQGINVVNIKDVTPIPHNGCRPKKPRRV